MAVLERTIESYLVYTVEAAGGVAEKTVSPSGRGYFDRVVVLPGGRVIFVEVKRPKRSTVSAHQRRRHEIYQMLGAEVAVVRTYADVDRLIEKGVDLGGSDDPQQSVPVP
jgi:tRNA U54 and U55 pseudouridine synthase Pus10